MCTWVVRADMSPSCVYVVESHFESLCSVAAVDADADVHAEIVGPSADDDTRKNVVKWRERHGKKCSCLADLQCDMKERGLCFQSLAT